MFGLHREILMRSLSLINYAFMNNILRELQAGFRHWTAAVTGFAVWQSCPSQQTPTSHNSSSLTADTLPWEGVISLKLSFCSLLNRFLGFLRRIKSSLICNPFPTKKRHPRLMKMASQKEKAPNGSFHLIYFPLTLLWNTLRVSLSVEDSDRRSTLEHVCATRMQT